MTKPALPADAVPMLVDIARAHHNALIGKTDPRDPCPGVEGIFRDHNCWACKNGAQPCREGSANLCSYPHARND